MRLYSALHLAALVAVLLFASALAQEEGAAPAIDEAAADAGAVIAPDSIVNANLPSLSKYPL